MIADTLQGIRERRGRRWFLILPVVLVGTSMMWVVAAVASTIAQPWLWDNDSDGGPGFYILFFIVYTAVVLGAIAAPRFKAAVACVIVACIIGLGVWGYFDPACAIPVDFLAGIAVGGFAAWILVFFKWTPRWLLIVPAYVAGWIILVVPLMALMVLFTPTSDGASQATYMQTVFQILDFAGAFGAVAFPALIAPKHGDKVAIICACVNLSLGIWSLVFWLEYKAPETLVLPAFFLGSALAVFWIIVRSSPSFLGWKRRKDSPTASA